MNAEPVFKYGQLVELATGEQEGKSARVMETWTDKNGRVTGYGVRLTVGAIIGSYRLLEPSELRPRQK